MPHDPGDKQYLKDVADIVKNKMPEGYGFIVFAFPFRETGRMFYLSNGEREDCIPALEEWIRNAKAHGFGKHV